MCIFVVLTQRLVIVIRHIIEIQVYPTTERKRDRRRIHKVPKRRVIPPSRPTMRRSRVRRVRHQDDIDFLSQPMCAETPSERVAFRCESVQLQCREGFDWWSSFFEEPGRQWIKWLADCGLVEQLVYPLTSVREVLHTGKCSKRISRAWR